MENQIKEGDVVQLKSGGPHMTVTATNETRAWCTYFNLDTNELFEDVTFNLTSLTK